MSFGRYAADNESRIDFQLMRKDRLERIRKLAKQKGVDTLLLLHGQNMRYAGHNRPNSMVQGANGFRFMIIPVNSGIPILYEYGMWQPAVAANMDWMDVRISASFHPQGPPEARARQFSKAAEQIKSALHEVGSGGASKNSISLDVYNFALAKELEKLGISVDVRADEVMREARKKKTSNEVESIRIAASIAEAGFDVVKRSIVPGVTESEIKGKFVNELFRLGMEYVPSGEVTSGPRTFVNNNSTSDRMIRRGDNIIAMACNSSFMGYMVCYYRTFICGQPNQQQKDCFNQTRDILYDAIKIVKPGITTKDIVEKWPKAEEFGYKNEDAALWVQWGHGIGVGIPEDPTCSRLWSLDYPEKIEEGMTIALETWLPTKERSGTYPRGQSTRIEEMMYVTSSGAELISKYPIDELIVGGL